MINKNSVLCPPTRSGSPWEHCVISDDCSERDTSSISVHLISCVCCQGFSDYCARKRASSTGTEEQLSDVTK